MARSRTARRASATELEEVPMERREPCDIDIVTSFNRLVGLLTPNASRGPAVTVRYTFNPGEQATAQRHQDRTVGSLHTLQRIQRDCTTLTVDQVEGLLRNASRIVTTALKGTGSDSDVAFVQAMLCASRLFDAIFCQIKDKARTMPELAAASSGSGGRVEMPDVSTRAAAPATVA